jgi:glycosyltransferase involved in cell wall biosynthesis
LVRNESDDGVVLAGSIDASEVADWYTAADLHIFPSLGDVWGLVVNEASACGTPSLCSIHAGCCEDMIRHGRDGLVYDPTAPSAAQDIADALSRADLSTLGDAARSTASRFTLDRLAGAFREAVDRAVACDGGHVGAHADTPG